MAWGLWQWWEAVFTFQFIQLLGQLENLAEWVCNFVAFRTRKIEMKAGAKIVSLSVCRFATYSVQYMYSRT